PVTLSDLDLSGAQADDYTLTQPTGLTADITGPSVSFSTAHYAVGEADGAATIKVILSETSGYTVTIEYATSNGSATTADNDYLAASGTLTFAPGDTSKSFQVPVISD